jgi:hypothetical protein
MNCVELVGNFRFLNCRAVTHLRKNLDFAAGGAPLRVGMPQGFRACGRGLVVFYRRRTDEGDCQGSWSS